MKLKINASLLLVLFYTSTIFSSDGVEKQPILLAKNMGLIVPTDNGEENKFEEGGYLSGNFEIKEMSFDPLTNKITVSAKDKTGYRVVKYEVPLNGKISTNSTYFERFLKDLGSYTQINGRAKDRSLVVASVPQGDPNKDQVELSPNEFNINFSNLKDPTQASLESRTHRGNLNILELSFHDNFLEKGSQKPVFKAHLETRNTKLIDDSIQSVFYDEENGVKSIVLRGSPIPEEIINNLVDKKVGELSVLVVGGNVNSQDIKRVAHSIIEELKKLDSRFDESKKEVYEIRFATMIDNKIDAMRKEKRNPAPGLKTVLSEAISDIVKKTMDYRFVISEETLKKASEEEIFTRLVAFMKDGNYEFALKTDAKPGEPIDISALIFKKIKVVGIEHNSYRKVIDVIEKEKLYAQWGATAAQNPNAGKAILNVGKRGI